MYSLHLQLLSLGVCSFFCGHATEVLQRLTSQTGRSRHGPGEALAAPVVAAIPGERFTACHRPRPARPTSRHQNAHGPTRIPPETPNAKTPKETQNPEIAQGLTRRWRPPPRRLRPRPSLERKHWGFGAQCRVLQCGALGLRALGCEV